MPMMVCVMVCVKLLAAIHMELLCYDVDGNQSEGSTMKDFTAQCGH